MGTRNLTSVYEGGEFKVAQYGQWDGYPEHTGVKILEFLREDLDRDKFIAKLDLLEEITEKKWDEIYLDVLLKRRSEWISMEDSNKIAEAYPSLHRDTGWEILPMIQNTEEKLLIERYPDFIENNLSCEWAYLINFDDNRFEVYSSRSVTRLTSNNTFKERFDNPIPAIVDFPLDNLPDMGDFLMHFEDE